MKPRRRYLTFSLRTLFVLLTIGCIWLGILAERAREQREAVEAIEALGGYVIYDWEPELEKVEQLSVPHIVFLRDRCPPGRPEGWPWLRKLIGDDYFQHVVTVISPQYSIYNYSVSQSDVRRWIPVFQSLKGLKVLIVQGSLPDDLMDMLRNELPRCQIIHERGFDDSPR